MGRSDSGSITEHMGRDGVIRYRVRVTVNGERKSLGLFDTRAHAAVVLDAALEQQSGEEKGITLAAWGETWLDRRETDGLHRAAHKSRSCWRTHVSKAHFAAWPMRRIQRIDVVKWIRALLRTEATSVKKTAGVVEHRGLGRHLSRQTVLNALALLRRALGDAADDGLVPTNAATGVTVPRVARTDDTWTYLDAAEIAAILAVSHLDDAQRAIFTVAIYTGLRAGELWGLQWADVRLDGERPELVVRHSYRGPTKSGRPRRVPLLSPARLALEAWRKKRPGVGIALVFPADSERRADGRAGCHSEGFDAGFAVAKKAAGIVRRVRFHDLRHTCASHLITGTWGRAWSLEEVQQMLGHGSRVTTERYAHLGPDALHAAARDTVLNGHQSDTARPLNKS